MANDLIVRILGDTKGLERSFARANQSSAQFGRQMETTGAKIDKTTKKFSAFTRGAATGFAGAFAATAVIDQIRRATAAAAEQEQILGQTRVALEATGKSWDQYGDTIEDTIKRQSRLGFDDEELLKTFSAFQRTTGDVNKALKLNNLALDVARARYISLDQAAKLVTKASLGQAGALRRLGIDTKGATTGVQLLTLLNEKYGGSAEAAADDASTSFARTQVAVENLQESVGTLLLPALEVLSENLQTAAEFAENLTTALGKLGRIKIPPIEIPFFGTFGGKSLGDLAGDAIGVAKFTPLNPLFGLTIANAIANQFRDQAEAATPNLAKSIKDSMDDMVSGALSAAGTFGITKLPQGGEDLALKFGSGIAGAIEAAQALAAKTIKTGKARIAAEKAADAAAKAQEAAEIAAEKELARRRAARARTQANQFRALGLAASGDEIVPGIKNLQTRITGALRRIDAGEIDVSAKLVERLKLARALIKKEGGKVTEETRRVINDLIRTVTQGTKALEDKGGPLTKATGLNVQKVLDGLGLTPEVERELRQRLSGINSAGMGRVGNRPTGNFRSSAPPVQVNTTVTMDDQVVGRSVTKTQQKDKRRNPKAKRGPRSGI